MSASLKARPAGPSAASSPLRSRPPLPPELLPEVVTQPRYRRLKPYYYLLSRDAGLEIADELRSRLRSAYAAALEQSIALHRDLLHLLPLFEERGVAVIPLKGTSLSLRLYGELARPTADLDLFVRPEDLEGATRVLTQDGYEAPRESGHYDLIFHKPGHRAVELHHDLGYFARTAQTLTEDFWARATLSATEGHPHWQLQSTDELLYLCLNLVRHRFEDPFLGLDIDLAVERWRGLVDWQALSERTAGYGLSGHVAAAFQFARFWYGTTVPHELEPIVRRTRWKTTFLRHLEWKRSIPNLFEPFLKHLPYRVHTHLLFHLLWLAESWRDRYDHLQRAAATGTRIFRRRRPTHAKPNS